MTTMWAVDTGVFAVGVFIFLVRGVASLRGRSVRATVHRVGFARGLRKHGLRLLPIALLAGFATWRSSLPIVWAVVAVLHLLLILVTLGVSMTEVTRAAEGTTRAQDVTIREQIIRKQRADNRIFGTIITALLLGVWLYSWHHLFWGPVTT